MSAPAAIAAIELAMVTRLRAAEPLLGYSWSRLESWPDDWESYIDAKGGEIRDSSAWVTFAGADDVREEASGVVSMRGQFYVLVGCQAIKDEARRHGAGSIPGVYRLVQDVMLLLSGQTLGLDISRLVPGDFRPVRIPDTQRKRGLAVFAIGFTTRLAFAPAEADLDRFEQLHANWDLRPFGGIDADPVAPGIQLADDAHADATDTIDLEQPDD